MLSLNRLNKQNKIFLLITLLLVLIFILFGYQAYKIAFEKNWSDLAIYTAASKQILTGDNPYLKIVHGNYIYPLTLSYLLVPITFLHPYLIHIIWYLLSITAYYYSITILFELFNTPQKRQLNIGVVITILFISIIQDDLIHSNINLIILFLTVLSARYLLIQKYILSLLFLSLAIALKLSPIVLSMWVALSIQTKFKSLYKTINYSLVLMLFVFTLTIAIPYILHGFQVITWYEYYFDNFILNQLKFAGTTKYNITLAGGINTMIGNHSSPSFSLKLLCGLLLCIFPFIVAVVKNNIKGTYTLFMLIILLTGTNAEQHHFVFIIPSIVLLLSKFHNNKLVLGTMIIPFNNKNLFIINILACIFILMILWGNNVAIIPIEMFGLLSIFILTFVFLFYEERSSSSYIEKV
jgi:hypothetical protein